MKIPSPAQDEGEHLVVPPAFATNPRGLVTSFRGITAPAVLLTAVLHTAPAEATGLCPTGHRGGKHPRLNRLAPAAGSLHERWMRSPGWVFLVYPHYTEGRRNVKGALSPARRKRGQRGDPRGPYTFLRKLPSSCPLPHTALWAKVKA